MATDKAGNKIRFIRVNGRVIPIQDKGPNALKADMNKGRAAVGNAYQKGRSKGSKVGAGATAVAATALVSNKTKGRGFSKISTRLKYLGKLHKTGRGRAGLGFVGISAIAGALGGGIIGGNVSARKQTKKEVKKLTDKYMPVTRSKNRTGV